MRSDWRSALMVCASPFRPPGKQLGNNSRLVDLHRGLWWSVPIARRWCRYLLSTMVMRFATPRRNVITDTSLISFSLSSSTPASQGCRAFMLLACLSIQSYKGNYEKKTLWFSLKSNLTVSRLQLRWLRQRDRGLITFGRLWSEQGRRLFHLEGRSVRR